MKILVTGAAGFIGAALCRKLAEQGHDVTGVDSLNEYYDPRLKLARLKYNGFHFPQFPPSTVSPCVGKNRGDSVIVELPEFGETFVSQEYKLLSFIRLDITDRIVLPDLFQREHFEIVVNLAAQAGVRYSLENPFAYAETNIIGFLNLLEAARMYPPRHFIYASSSSVYGTNAKIPFSESDRVDSPVSLYAATKKSNELMASVYADIYGLNMTGLRFFTVYGPWGRPDMAPMIFANAISENNPIKVFNNGNMKRDFTYIDDIVEGICRVIDLDINNRKDNRHGTGSNMLLNIGCGQPINLMDFIEILQTELGKKAQLQMLPMQPGDVTQTYADTTELERLTNYRPTTTLRHGIREFANWFKHHTDTTNS